MSTTILTPQLLNESVEGSIQQQITSMIDELAAQLPKPAHLSSEDRRGIIARYTAVLEGNFIYWMTATYLATKCEEARPVLLDNLYEEVRDSHPVMLRKFAVAAHAIPTDVDSLAVDADMTKVRLFLGKLQGVQSLATMAFFEGYIQKFMAYLAELAALQGSKEMEYTDVHGVCDIAHSQGLFNAVVLEMAVSPLSPDADLFEGVDLLRTLVNTIVQGPLAVAR